MAKVKNVVTLDKESLEELSKAIAKSIVSELIGKIGDINLPTCSQEQHSKSDQTSKTRITIDESVYDVGSSIDGIEANFKEIAKSEKSYDADLDKSKNKLKQLKQKLEENKDE
ncbi:hypothetical protein GF373_17440 [bacterium]|nr:hypothetical protein [bacterium]